MNHWIGRADRALGSAEFGLLLISVAALFAIGVFMVAVIAARQFLGVGVPDDSIIVQQLMLVAIACSLGYVTRQKAHIAIDILYVHLGRRAQRVCDVLAGLIGLVAFLPVSLWAWGDFLLVWETGRFHYGQLQLPHWPGNFFFALGLTLLCLRLALILVSDMTDRADRDPTQKFVKLDIG